MTAPESSPKPAAAAIAPPSKRRPLYAERDVEALGEFYVLHVSAMTGEGLHSKSDIAAELAYRDAYIAQLEAAAIQRGDGQTDRSDVEALEDYFNGTDYTAKLNTAQLEANAWHAALAWERSRKSTPPAAKPNETSGATPAVGTAIKALKAIQIDGGEDESGSEEQCVGWPSRDLINTALRELNAVRKSSGAAGAGAAEACLAEIRALMPKEWDGMELVWCVLQLKKAAKSTPGVEAAIEAATNLSAWIKTHDFPQFGTPEFVELTMLADKQDTALRKLRAVKHEQIGGAT